MDGTTGLQPGQVLTSKNGASAPPPPPPPECEQVINGETVLEDDGGCMSLTGGALSDADGHGGHAYATEQDNPSPDYAQGGVWQLDFAQAGAYELWAHIPATVTDLTPAAEYKVAYDGQSALVHVDQAAAAGTWAYLGTFAFAAGAEQWVRLGDNYGDPSTNGKQIVLDALQVVPSDGCECDDPLATDIQSCGDSGTQTRSCDGCYWSSWSECSEAPSGSSSGSGGADSSDPRLLGDDAITGGGLHGTVCSTRPGSPRPDGLALLVLSAAALALGGRSTRRRNRPRR
ncbi:MAG: hypothetical protein DRI90_24275 [Deltaproteobacteria bacterium]|nr:MAG: hypothetical protein DRI90_24275 [Deltaproteobacteria bacterium]